MVSACSTATNPKSISFRREKSASELLSDLTVGVANWISRPSQISMLRRKRSDSAESCNSSTESVSSDDSKFSSGVSSPTDITSTGRRLIKASRRLVPDEAPPKLQDVTGLRRRLAAARDGETARSHTGQEESTSPNVAAINKTQSSTDKPLWPCVLYGACAFMIHIVNKGFFSVWGFKGTFVFSLVQSIVTCCFFTVALALGVWKLPNMSWREQRRLLLLPVLFVCNTSFALIGLQHTVLPMYLVLRRMVTPAVLLGEYLVWGKTSSVGVVCACALLFLGSVVAGASDLKIDLFGYACTTIANVFTVAYTMYMKELSSVTSSGHMQVTDIMFFNALYSVPLLLLAATVTGELQAAAAYPHLVSPLFQASLVAASAMGILYQGAMVLSNTRTTPLATSIAGNVKDVACSFVGYTLFDSGPPSLTNLVGLSMSMGGAFWYMALNTKLI